MITIQEYKKAVKEESKISQAEEVQKKIFEKERRNTSDKFWKLERSLRDKKSKEEQKTEKAIDKFKDNIETEKKPHFEKMKAFKRILKFMDIEKEKELNPLVYFYDYPKDEKGEVIRTKEGNYPEKEKQYIDPIETIKNDEFAKISVFICGNRKPKNKYTLCVIGSTILNEDLLKVPYSYGLDVHTDNANIRSWIRDAPNKKELVTYLEKNKDKILKDFLEEHEKTQEEYKEALEITNCKEWKIAYWENKKDYYENHYSNGTETPEYKAVLKKLKELN